MSNDQKVEFIWSDVERFGYPQEEGEYIVTLNEKVFGSDLRLMYWHPNRDVHYGWENVSAWAAAPNGYKKLEKWIVYEVSKIGGESYIIDISNLGVRLGGGLRSVKRVAVYDFKEDAISGAVHAESLHFSAFASICLDDFKEEKMSDDCYALIPNNPDKSFLNKDYIIVRVDKEG